MCQQLLDLMAVMHLMLPPAYSLQFFSAAVSHRFRQQVFNLPVDGAEFILRPCAEFLIESGIQPQRDLLFLFFRLFLFSQRAIPPL